MLFALLSLSILPNILLLGFQDSAQTIFPPASLISPLLPPTSTPDLGMLLFPFLRTGSLDL